MNIIKPFYYMFKEKSGYLSLLIGTLVYIPLFIMTLLSSNQKYLDDFLLYTVITIGYYLVSGMVTILVNGYYYCNSNSRLENPEAPAIEWRNFKQILLTGLKGMAAGWIYAVPFILILFGAFLMFVTNTFELDGPFIPEKNAYYPLTFKIGNGILLFWGIFMPIAYVSDLKFISLFNLKKIFSIIKNDFLGFFVYAVFVALNLAICFVLSNLTGYYPYILIPISALIFFYFTMVQSDIIAQFVRKGCQKLDAIKEDNKTE